VPSTAGQKHEFSSLEELIMGGTAGGGSTSSLQFDVGFMKFVNEYYSISFRNIFEYRLWSQKMTVQNLSIASTCIEFFLMLSCCMSFSNFHTLGDQASYFSVVYCYVCRSECFSDNSHGCVED
jgi:hypothetical protein